MKKLFCIFLIITLLFSYCAAEEQYGLNIPTEEELEEIFTEEPYEEKDVIIWISLKKMYHVGESVTIYSKLLGNWDGCIWFYQWQVDYGEGYIDIDGATEAEYTFYATQQSLRASYRLQVEYYTIEEYEEMNKLPE